MILVSVDDWDALLKRLTAKTETITGAVRDTDRFILGSAFELSFDEQGRAVIPEILAKYAGFSDTVAFLGLGSRVEVWDRKKWEEREREISKNASSLLEKIAKDSRDGSS